MNLKEKVLTPHTPLRLYSTTPPRQNSSEEKVRTVAEKLAARIEDLDVDALIVYDVQDEPGQVDEPRPFPFLPTIDSRYYASLLQQLTGRDVIAYKCVVHTPKENFAHWAHETLNDYNIKHVALVGGAVAPEEYSGITLPESIAVANETGLFCGGVTIPERHDLECSEHKRVFAKEQLGMNFFTSQVIYNPGITIQFLRDYGKLCLEQGKSPAHINLTFVPCGRKKTMNFLRWLGVNVPEIVEKQILSAENPLDASVAMCVEHLQTILSAVKDVPLSLGINVESVSIYKNEIDASIELFKQLSASIEEYSQKTSLAE